MRFSKTFFLGFVGGAFLTLALGILVRAGGAPRPSEVVVEMEGEVLTEEALRKQVAADLIPIENDEYELLRRGGEEWLQARLLEKEAKAQGITLEELYRKEIWGRVRISYDEILVHYHKNRELYPDPFETLSPSLSQQLRQNEYARLKEEYLGRLRKKYNVQIHLKKPASYVEGLALPSPPPDFPKKGAETPPLPLPGAGPAPLPGSSERGIFPSRGPVDAGVTLEEFSDFHCPFCKRLNPTLEEILKNYPDKVRRVFRHYPLSIHPGSDKTHEASVCAQEQGKFWEFHDALYALSNLSQETDLGGVAQKVGLNLVAFQECLQSGRLRGVVQKDLDEGTRKGVQGTPTVFVNDQLVGGAYPYHYFVNLIEGILDPTKAAQGGERPTPAASPAPSPPSVVRFDDLEGRPSLGPKAAPVTLVEFSDFHCPFCKRVGPTLEELMKNYSGKIRRVWRHYPLSLHAGAERTHEASECAAGQDKFWEYHDKLFETQGSARDDPALIGLAKEVGLNKKKFEQCLASGKYRELIQREISRAQAVGVQGTPAVFVNGRLVSGARPYAQYEQLIKEELAKSIGGG